MTELEIIERILGPKCSLTDVKSAFTNTNKTNPEYHWTADVSLRGETIFIDGQIFCNWTELVGRFERRLFYSKGSARASHLVIEIDQNHWRRKNALHQYIDVLAFYVAHGIRFVHLEADGTGPVVWPQFGFDLTKQQHKERLARILREKAVPDIPTDATEIFVPLVSQIKGPMGEAGQESLRLLRQLEDRPLPMTLDLADRDQREFLAEAGILPLQDLKGDRPC